MKYSNVLPGKFISRPNRFIANIELDGKIQVCHVKNTGRCKELLIPGAEVYLQKSDNPLRKTAYDLITVKKNDCYVNIDSQAPNKIFHEWIKNSEFLKNVVTIKPEFTYGSSRFDFCIETEAKNFLIEVKGVTLEQDGVCAFPDAPTLRGLRHVNELCKCKSEGFDAAVFFIIQMESVHSFVPNRLTQPDFAEALIKARENSVGIYALNCSVSPDSIEAKDFIDINLEGGGYFG